MHTFFAASTLGSTQAWRCTRACTARGPAAPRVLELGPSPLAHRIHRVVHVARPRHPRRRQGHRLRLCRLASSAAFGHSVAATRAAARRLT